MSIRTSQLLITYPTQQSFIKKKKKKTPLLTFGSVSNLLDKHWSQLQFSKRLQNDISRMNKSCLQIDKFCKQDFANSPACLFTEGQSCKHRRSSARLLGARIEK